MGEALCQQNLAGDDDGDAPLSIALDAFAAIYEATIYANGAVLQDASLEPVGGVWKVMASLGTPMPD